SRDGGWRRRQLLRLVSQGRETRYVGAVRDVGRHAVPAFNDSNQITSRILKRAGNSPFLLAAYSWQSEAKKGDKQKKGTDPFKTIKISNSYSCFPLGKYIPGNSIRGE